MRVEELLYSVLQPVFGDELYPVRHPDPDGLSDSVSTLFAIYTKIGGQSFNTMTGDTGLSRIRIQISIYSIDYTQLKQKETEVNTAMQVANELADVSIDPYNTLGVLKNVSSTVPIDGYEADSKRFCTHMDFYCWEKV